MKAFLAIFSAIASLASIMSWLGWTIFPSSSILFQHPQAVTSPVTQATTTPSTATSPTKLVSPGVSASILPVSLPPANTAIATPPATAPAGAINSCNFPQTGTDLFKFGDDEILRGVYDNCKITFYYQRVSEMMAEEGVVPGDEYGVFKVDAGQISGWASGRSKSCGTIPYDIQGFSSDGLAEIQFSGWKKRVQADNCAFGDTVFVKGHLAKL